MKTSLSLMAALFIMAAFSAPAQSQSLGDVARQSQASTTKKAKVVVTEDDIPPSAAAETDESNTKDADKKDEATTASKHTDALPKEPSKENVAVLKAKVEDLKSKQQEYQTSIAQLEQKLQNAETEFRAQVYREALENNRHSLKVFTEQRDAAEKALATMEQQMKQGGDNTTAGN